MLYKRYWESKQVDIFNWNYTKITIELLMSFFEKHQLSTSNSRWYDKCLMCSFRNLNYSKINFSFAAQFVNDLSKSFKSRRWGWGEQNLLLFIYKGREWGGKNGHFWRYIIYKRPLTWKMRSNHNEYLT